MGPDREVCAWGWRRSDGLQLEGVVSLGALEVRHNDEVGSTSALARLHEQRLVSRGDLPRHGVTHRHELDALAGCELNLCRYADRAPDLDHVSIGVIDLAYTSIRNQPDGRRERKEGVST